MIALNKKAAKSLVCFWFVCPELSHYGIDNLFIFSLDPNKHVGDVECAVYWLQKSNWIILK